MLLAGLLESASDKEGAAEEYSFGVLRASASQTDMLQCLLHELESTLANERAEFKRAVAVLKEENVGQYFVGCD